MASDRYGAKLTLFVAMVVWSLFSGAVALAFGFVSLLIIRILFGMGEGPLSATINKMVNNWFPPAQRASVISVTNSGTPLGSHFRPDCRHDRSRVQLEGILRSHYDYWLDMGSALVQVCQRKAASGDG